jgi:nucleoside-triphosphatase THEP1
MVLLLHSPHTNLDERLQESSITTSRRWRSQYFILSFLPTNKRAIKNQLTRLCRMSSTSAPPRRALTGHVVHDFNALQSSQTGHNVHNFTALQSSQVNIGDHYYSRATIVNQKPDSLHNWISPIEYWKHHKFVFDDLHPGSGEWLLNKNEFESWEPSTQTSVLWLHGIPGSGKSKLVSKVIDYLKPKYRSAGTFAYFYCTRNPAEDERSRPKEVIPSFLRQLGFTGTDPKVLKPALASLRTAKEEEAKEHGSEVVEPLNPKECVDTLIKILQGSTTVIAIDAIDELKSEERHEFYKTLSRILNDVDQGVVRVFLSSRDDQDIVHQLSKHANVYISAADNQYDVEEFVKKEVGEATSSGRLLRGRKTISDSLGEKIISTLTGGAQGM